MVANEFHGSASPLAFVGCVDCLAANNTIDTPDNWIIRILQETTTQDGFEFLPASNGRFITNVVYFDRSGISTYVNIGPDAAPGTFEFANNLWYAYDDPGQSDPAGDLPSVEQDGIVGEDPMLASAAEFDYAIAPASPAAGAGQALAEVEADAGFMCYGDPPSIGAREVP